MGKAIYAIIFGAAAACYAAYRWISNKRNSNFGAKLVKALDTSPELIAEVAADYQNQYAKIPYTDGKSIQKRLDSIKKGQLVLGKYQVMGIYPLHNDGVLMVTSCRNKEVGEWKSNEVVRNYTFVFVVQKSPSSGEIEVCSDFYELLIDRLLRQDFAKYLAEILEKNA